MKKFKKSTSITIALLIYVSATAAYFLPRNTVISDTEKYVTVVLCDCVNSLAGVAQERRATAEAS